LWNDLQLAAVDEQEGGKTSISSFTNSFFPLAQVKKAAKRDKSGRSKKLCG